MLRKQAHRLTPEQTSSVRGAIDALSAAVISRDFDKLGPALNALDEQLDRQLSFARKSTAREYVESIGVAVLIALLLRAFVVEAFKIPSGSMIPTLQVGDHIFVNKFIYGVRIPFTDIKLGMDYRAPHRGEVVVFKWPKNPSIDFIKRVIAVPGDVVEIRDNQLIINGKPVPRHQVPGDCRYEDYSEETGQWEERRCQAWQETLDGNTYTTYYDQDGPPHSWEPHKIPPGRFFAMGDNRDNSNDSRFWGYVPYPLLKGKAMVIWFSIGEPPADGIPLVKWLEGLRYHRFFHLVH